MHIAIYVAVFAFTSLIFLAVYRTIAVPANRKIEPGQRLAVLEESLREALQVGGEDEDVVLLAKRYREAGAAVQAELETLEIAEDEELLTKVKRINLAAQDLEWAGRLMGADRFHTNEVLHSAARTLADTSGALVR